MCNKAVDNYPDALKFVSECYKIKKIWYKVVDTCPTTIKYVSESYKTHETCYKAVHRVFLFDYIPDQYKTQEICDIFFSLYSFLKIFCPDK